MFLSSFVINSSCKIVPTRNLEIVAINDVLLLKAARGVGVADCRLNMFLGPVSK